MKRLKLVYLLFLLFPLVYGLLWSYNTDISTDNKLPDYFYFSAKTSKAATLNLISERDTLIKWELNSKGYKLLQFVGHVNDANGFKITVNNLQNNDTIAFLGFNLFRNQQLYSILSGSSNNIAIENAILIEKDGMLKLLVQKSDKAVIINLKPFSSWQTNDMHHSHSNVLILIFAFAFLLIIIFAPPIRNFIVSISISLFVMLICYMADTGTIDRVSMSNNSPLKGSEIYYSNSPFFSPYKRYSSVSEATEFKVPLNLEINNFIRCDVDGSMKELNDFTIKMKSGIFHSSFNLASLPQGNLVLNDVVLIGKSYYITGDDPFFGLTSTYFEYRINWLLFLKHNQFLFIALLVLLISLFIHPVSKRLKNIIGKLQFKAAYFAFLLIPITYYFISHNWAGEVVSNCSDQVYLSAHTSKPSVISLFNGSDSLCSWTLDSPSFKYLPYTGPLDLNSSFYLKIDKLSENDTISLLSVNLFHNDKVYSLLDRNEAVCGITNAIPVNNTDEIKATVLKSKEAVIVNLLPFSVMKNNQPNQLIDIIILLMFLVAFVVVIIVSPKSGYFIVISIVTSILMLFYFWVSNDMQYQVTLSTSTPIKRVDFFYNDNPVFSPKKVNIDLKGTSFFKSQVDLSKFNFLRCDVEESTKELKDLHICTKTGLIRNNWDYSKISSDKLMMNDMLRVGDTYYVCGGDPFFILSTSNQVDGIRLITLLRQNIFFLITFFLFLFLILSNRLAHKHNPIAFLLFVVFLVFISFGLMLRLFNSDRIEMTSEKRFASPMPTFNIDSASIFVQNLDNYLKDQIAGRNNIITTNNLLEYSVFRQLINNPTVHFGLDGRLFLITGIVKEDYENRYPLTNDELRKMKDVLLARKNWLKKKGIHFYLIFPPMAYSVYDEYVGPRLWHYNKKSKIQQLLEYLKTSSDLDVIDIYSPIMEAKKKISTNLYFKENCHWNYFGSYVAYRAMVNYIKRDFSNIGDPLTLKDITWVKDKNYFADLLRPLAIEKFYPTDELAPKFKNVVITDTVYPVYPDFHPPFAPACIHTNRKDCPSMLMYGDSYAGCLLSFLTYNFNRTTFLWTPTLQPAIIEKEKPDIVIQEMVAAWVYNLLNENPPLPEVKDTIRKQPE
ncbi:MAG: hypothetical protein WCH34_01770 [Bacteroidota bacterium]